MFTMGPPLSKKSSICNPKRATLREKVEDIKKMANLGSARGEESKEESIEEQSPCLINNNINDI